MKSNILLIYGDNASGKTRYLLDIIEKYKDSGESVVHNIKSLESDSYAIDLHKQELVNDLDSSVYEKMIELNGTTKYSRELRSILEYIMSRGNILVLDELDSNLTLQDMLDVCDIICRIKHTWDKIYISGYSLDLTRLFYNEDIETGIAYHDDNIVYIDNDGTVREVSEVDLIEFMRKIRG